MEVATQVKNHTSIDQVSQLDVSEQFSVLLDAIHDLQNSQSALKDGQTALKNGQAEIMKKIKGMKGTKTPVTAFLLMHLCKLCICHLVLFHCYISSRYPVCSLGVSNTKCKLQDLHRAVPGYDDVEVPDNMV